MKQIKKWAGLLSMILMFGSGALAPSRLKAQPGISVSINVFYDELRPHGTWRQDPVYGQVWQPRVERGFRPYYTRGHWVMTDAGNCWTSDYDWGWAPFHYGRWVERRNIGWVWVPGTQWAPAWVSWRSGGDDYGWAPMTPEVNINIEIGGGHRNPRYTSDYYYNGYGNEYDYGYDAYQEDIPVDYWVFVPRVEVYRPDFYRYDRGPRYNTTIIHNTTIVNNTYVYNNVRYASGPRPDDYRRATGRQVEVYRLRDFNRPGRPVIQNNVVNIYRPNIKTAVRNSRFANNRSLAIERAHQRLINRTENARLASERRNGNRNVPNPNARQWTGNRAQQLQEQRAQRQQQQLNQKAAVHNSVLQRRAQIQEQRQAQRQQAIQQKQQVQAQRKDQTQQQKANAQAQNREAAQQKRQQEQAQRLQQVQQQRERAQSQRAAQAAQQKQQAQAQKEAQRNQAAQQQKTRQQEQRAAQAAQHQQAAQRQKEQAQSQRAAEAAQRQQAAQRQREQAQAQHEAQRNQAAQQQREQHQAQQQQRQQAAQQQRQQEQAQRAAQAQQQRQQGQAQRAAEAQQKRQAADAARDARRQEHQNNRNK